MRIEASTSVAKSGEPADGPGVTDVLMMTTVPSMSRTHKVSIEPARYPDLWSSVCQLVSVGIWVLTSSNEL